MPPTPASVGKMPYLRMAPRTKKHGDGEGEGREHRTALMKSLADGHQAAERERNEQCRA
jgi:hypothetical protein